ncbi:dienelactone hydrolase family protein [Actinomadura opuntiae]|uniref:dienelactone hydrolase family protein n=1 Tax=Actinomadura sp. OS1-43 TaxID=604315 RepID=UPI00255AC13A|nr:dienelactone hydrolase family protein [Actinomadura sp. OS1-43]MDL4821798.1 dienelactone hydrolase family protein [Actinomadura sp. OS1-43]
MTTAIEHGTWIDIETPDGTMRAYTCNPAARPAAAVVVLQEAFGVTDYVQDVTRRLAREGYLAVAPDLFHREERQRLDYDDTATAMATIGRLGPDQIIPDVRAAIGEVERRHGIGCGSVALPGFCFGGRAAFTAATAGDPLAGTVVFYGRGIASGPWAVLNRHVADAAWAKTLCFLGSVTGRRER